ncbi:MAG: hypothetical protein SPJ57_02710 [Candidatus Methanomethylophilaceae archaeon]|nr:hypothetical protein [Candidatus Methanomethylophilaceae archaeon]
MEKNAIIAICVVAVLAVAGGAAGFIILNNNDNGDPSGETYWYYIYFGDGEKNNGWYSATGNDATDGFKKAMDAAGFTYSKSKLGYIGEINDVSGSWWHGAYVYSDYSKEAQNNSVGSAVKDVTNVLLSANGWIQNSGYSAEGVTDIKLYQTNANVWYLTPYGDQVEGKYNLKTPDVVDSWMNDGPFKTTAPTKTETYWFYLYFGADNAKSKWYSAEGTDASAAFDKAVKDAGLTYEISKWGYVGTIDEEGDNGWSCFCYTYTQTDDTAASNSIKGDVKDGYGSPVKSKGWKSFSGYNVEGFEGLKLGQSNSTIWFMSMYNNDYSVPCPWDDGSYNAWKNSGPFATA